MIALCFISLLEHLLISFSVMAGTSPAMTMEASVRVIQVAASAFAVAQGAESTRKSRQSDLLYKVQP
ncbi:hypothetical protein [Bradyrhizobium oligotrophicum]|uniref:hypothetical protein n=1 Tax=Bradyrhizobium oligotrophicum TaxID=44255 RepID=UPI003EB95AC3